MKNLVIGTFITLIAIPAHAITVRGTANIAPVPPFLSAQVAFTEPSGNKMLDADESGVLVVTVKNSGKGVLLSNIIYRHILLDTSSNR